MEDNRSKDPGEPVMLRTSSGARLPSSSEAASPLSGRQGSCLVTDMHNSPGVKAPTERQQQTSERRVSVRPATAAVPRANAGLGDRDKYDEQDTTPLSGVGGTGGPEPSGRDGDGMDIDGGAAAASPPAAPMQPSNVSQTAMAPRQAQAPAADQAPSPGTVADATVTLATSSQVGQSNDAGSPMVSPTLSTKVFSGDKVKRKSKGRGKALDLDLDLPGLDSEPDLSEPEPEEEEEEEDDESELPNTAVLGLRRGSGPDGTAAAGGGHHGPEHGGGGGGGSAAGSRHGSHAQCSSDDTIGTSLINTDDEDGSSEDDRGAGKSRERGAGKSAAAAAAAAKAVELDAPSVWEDDNEYIYKDMDPNDLDIGIEFPKMDFKPEDLELPPDEWSCDPDEEGEEVVMGEDGKPVRRQRLSAAALAEGETFIGLEGLVSWGRDGTYRGTITRFDPHRSRLMWLMSYEDGDEEWGAVTEDRSGWRVHGGLRPVAWLIQPPPPTDPLNIAAAAADAVPAPPGSQRPPPPAQPQATGFIVNLMGAEIEVAVGRDGQTRLGTIVDLDPNRPRYKWYIRYVGYAEPAYGGTGEWGCLDDEKTTWHTHGYKRPVMAVTGGAGGLLPIAPTKPAGGAAASGFTARKGPFGRTSLGLMYLIAASEPAADGKPRLPVMALGAVRGAFGSPAGMAAAVGGKAALGFGLAVTGKPERVSSQAMAGVPDEYGATLVGAKITITVGRGQGHKRTGTITEYDGNRPKYRWRLTFDTVGELAHGGAAEWGMLSEDQSLWLAHGYKRNITALSGVPERKLRPTETVASPAPIKGLSPLSPFGATAVAAKPPALPWPRPLGEAAAPAAADGGGEVAGVAGEAAAGMMSPLELGADGKRRSQTEGPMDVSPNGAADVGGEGAVDGGPGGAHGTPAVKSEAQDDEGSGGDNLDPNFNTALASAAEAAVALYYGNTEVAERLGIDIASLGLEVEELGTNLIGARLLVAVGRAGARRSGTITDFEPNRPRYKWRLVYDPEVMPVGVTQTTDGAADAAAEGANAATEGTDAADGSGNAASPGPAAQAAGASATPQPDKSAGAEPSSAVEPAGGVTSPTPDGLAVMGAAGGASTVVEGEWGTLNEDRTAWLCHGYRRAILASEGVPALPPSYVSAAAAAAAVVAAQTPGRKRRPNVLDEQSVASALLTLGKRARREAKAAAAAAREARQVEVAASGGHVILVQSVMATGGAVIEAVTGGGGANGDAPAVGCGDGGDGGDTQGDAPRVKRMKVEPGTEGENGVTYVRQPVAVVAVPYGSQQGEAGAVDTTPVSPVANPEGVVGLEIEVVREDGPARGRVLSYDAKKPRLRWLVRYFDGNQEWGTIADDLTTLRVYGSVRTITWSSRPPAVLPKQSKNAAARARSTARASPAAPGVGGAGGTGAGTAGTSGDPAAAGSGFRTRRSSENGDGDWVGGMGSGYGSGGTDYRYIFRRNGMCRAQITHQGCAIISPYYDTPEAAAAAADYYNYKLRGTSAHLNLGLTPEQRLVLDQLTLEQLQAYIKGRGDVHDLAQALLQYGGPAGAELHARLQAHNAMMHQLQLQQQQLLQQQQQQLQQAQGGEFPSQQLQQHTQEGQAEHHQHHRRHEHLIQYCTQQDGGVTDMAADSRAPSVDPMDDVSPMESPSGSHLQRLRAPYGRDSHDEDMGDVGGETEMGAPFEERLRSQQQLHDMED